MTAILDRLLIYSYIKAYIICLLSLLSLYIVVDLFMNLDDFTGVKQDLVPVLLHVLKYYGCQSCFIFDRLSEAIVLLAAVFTVAWVQRSNELIPLLAAGVSVHRILRPILISACALVFVNIANQEVLIPRIGGLVSSRQDPVGEQKIAVSSVLDSRGIQLSGRTATRKDLQIEDFACIITPSVNGTLLLVPAKTARYLAPANEPRTGGWLLTGVQLPEHVVHARSEVLELIDPGRYFLYTDVDFDVMTRDSKKWFYTVSTMRLFQELNQKDSHTLARMAVFFHMRLTRPILGIILVLMGLSVILRDQNRNIFISAGSCLGLCALFFIANFAARYMGDQELLSPALAAWLPVFVFGPLSFTLFDAMHT